MKTHKGRGTVQFTNNLGNRWRLLVNIKPSVVSTPVWAPEQVVDGFVEEKMS